MLVALRSAYSEEEEFLTSIVQSQPEIASRYLQENDPYHKLTNEVIVDLIITKGGHSSACIALQQADPKSIVIEETTVSDLGYRLLDLTRTSDAVEVFEF
jgi:hypothetical protein